MELINKKVYDIKSIAIYVRKSRDETNGLEDVLSKHLNALIEFAEKNEWKFEIYKEIVSADRIDDRPEMIKLLKDIELCLYDAVLCIDQDRIGRGDLEDAGRIKRIFKKSETLLITPQKIIDFTDEDESKELQYNIEAVFARHELQIIKKRLNRGKKLGAKSGKWTNGKPPLPYVYNRELKKLEINKEQLDIYNLMKVKFFEGIPPQNIAFFLNQNEMRTARGRLWSEVTVYRTLISEVHLGKVIYGKSKGSGHKKKKDLNPLKQVPKDQWIVYENAHPAVKTLEEHLKILEILEQRKKQPRRKKNGIYIFSGLIRCGNCGRVMSFYTKPNGQQHLKPCYYKDPFGKKCINRGISNLKIFEVAIMTKLEEEKHKLYAIKTTNPNAEYVNSNLRDIEMKERDLEKLVLSLNRIKELYTMGDYTKAEYIKKKEAKFVEIAKKQDEVETLKRSIGEEIHKKTLIERISNLEAFQHNWLNCATDEEKNILLKKHVNQMVFSRPENDFQIEVVLN